MKSTGISVAVLQMLY